MLERQPRLLLHAVDDVSFDISRGETLGLVGESGCGKSTVARLIVGLYRLSQARSRTPASMSARSPTAGAIARCAASMQMIFQDPYASLNPRWRVVDIVAEPIRAQRLLRGRRAIAARVDELLEQVGLAAADGDKYPHEFSGGQRQRISIARALASEAGVPGLRRADVRARRLGAGAGAQPDARSAARARAHLSVHLAQSRRRASHRRPRRRHVSRAHRRAAPTRRRCSRRRSIPTRGCCSTRFPISR